MKNKILKGIAFAGLVLSLGACNKTNDDTIKYTLKVYDLDNEVLLDEKIEEKNDTSLYESLVKNTSFNVKASDSSFGHYIESISNSIIDPNYALMIYENNQLSNAGVDYIKLNDGDEITIKNECWSNQLDETDILVDKIMYKYSKYALHYFTGRDETYKNSNYWNYMLINIACDNSYDSHIFNAKDYTRSNLKDALVIDDNMDIADWGKYYHMAKALGVSLDTFKTKYTEFINNVQTDYSANYAEYSLPFGITMAKTLNITSANLEELVNTTYRCSTDWGTDSLMWQLTALAAFDKIDKDELDNITISIEKSDIYDSNFTVVGQHTNAISTALKLLPFAALGENPRAKKNADNKDLVELLIEDFYDAKTGYLKIYGDDEESDIDNININQIYASLMAYKISRDLDKKVNLFA